jgi:hypothetical protein
MRFNNKYFVLVFFLLSSQLYVICIHMKNNSDILNYACITYIKSKVTALKNRNFDLNSNIMSILFSNHLNRPNFN